MDKAKLDALAKEKRALEAKVERCEGDVHLLQDEASDQEIEVIRIWDFIC